MPWTFSVAYVTSLNVQRRFSTHGVVGGLTGRAAARGTAASVCTSSFIVCLPSDVGVLKKRCRSYSSRSSELKPPFEVRSQSVQSLSPGVKIAGFSSALR